MHIDEPTVTFKWRLTFLEQESRVVARKSRNAAAVLFGLKFADSIHYNIKGPVVPRTG